MSRVLDLHIVVNAQTHRVPPYWDREQSVGASTEGTTHHPVFSISTISNHNTAVKAQLRREPPTMVGKWPDAPENNALVDPCEHVNSLKLTYLMDAGYTHNLLSNTVFDQLVAAAREQMEP